MDEGKHEEVVQFVMTKLGKRKKKKRKISESLEPKRKQQCLFKNFKTHTPTIPLPNEIITMIFEYCDQLQLLSNRMVCKQWRMIVDDPNNWRILSSKKNPKNFHKVLKFALPKFGNIVSHINVSETFGLVKRVHGSVLHLIGEYCTNLKYLNLRGANIPPKVIINIAKQNPILEWLNISGSLHLSGNSLSIITSHCKLLTHLIAKHCDLGTLSLENSNCLRVLCLSNNPSMGAHYMQPQGLYPVLEYLDLSFTRVNDQSVIQLAQNSPNLKVLVLNNCENINGTSFHLYPQRFSKLFSIDLSYSNIIDEGFQWLGQLPSLKYIDISWCKKLSSDAIYNFVHVCLEKDILKEFWFIGSALDGDTFEVLDQFSNLIPVDPSSCRNIHRSQRFQAREKEIPKRGGFLYPPPKMGETIS